MLCDEGHSEGSSLPEIMAAEQSFRIVDTLFCRTHHGKN
jgi:hypothetical protein